jgi:hypothetical protein
MEIIFVNKNPNFTIVCGLDEIINGIEITTFDLANNHKILNLLHFISMYAENDGSDKQKKYAFDFFCYYISAFDSDNSKKKFDILSKNPKLQILCSGELLGNLKSNF